MGAGQDTEKGVWGGGRVLWSRLERECEGGERMGGRGEQSAEERRAASRARSPHLVPSGDCGPPAQASPGPAARSRPPGPPVPPFSGFSPGLAAPAAP